MRRFGFPLTSPLRLPVMHCDNYDTGRCRSCSLMNVAYAEQLGDKDAAARRTLGVVIPETAWSAPFPSIESGFRNKAKLVVGGSPGAVTLGILDAAGRGVDLRTCGLYEPALHDAIPQLAAFVNDLRLLPYNVPKRRGELKHLIATVNTDGELLVRLVLRSDRQLARVRDAVPTLQRTLPGVRVVSVNLQPEHKAVLEGDTEIVLTPDAELPMRLPAVTLLLQPGSFFQTNTAVAAGLYAQAAQWAGAPEPTRIWDLHCGVGGFALHLQGQQRDVTGVEILPAAIASAREATSRAGGQARFLVGDATAFAKSSPSPPDLVVLNPPRRGIGPDLAAWLEDSSVETVLYSSCSAPSLAADLARMPSLRPRRARLFDMFPQTQHAELLVRLDRH